MIKPYGSDELNPLFVYDPEKRHALLKEAETLPSIVVSSATAGNIVMLGGGYFNPLTGFMNVQDAMSVAETLHTTQGLFWPVPILNVTQDASAIKDAGRIALRDSALEGNPVIAIQTVTGIETLTATQQATLIEKVFRTSDNQHPGVAAFLEQGNVVISGEVQVLGFSYFPQDFPDTFRTAVELRHEIMERGWKKTVAFQTRNPMHRAHEELCKMAKIGVQAEGVLIHMLLGKLKPGDIPAPVRDAAIRKMEELYFEPNTVMIAGYGFDMLYAGPREAVLHALFRQNSGCDYFIIGRDHAGVGDYYGAFDAQTIFDTEVPQGALQIEIFRADHTAYSKKLDRVVMMRDVPDHKKEDFILLSGTKVREMLSKGIAPPPEFTRPEVAVILMDYYQKEVAGKQ